MEKELVKKLVEDYWVNKISPFVKDSQGHGVSVAPTRVVKATVPLSTHESVSGLGKGKALSHFILFLTAYYVLLSRYFDEDALLIGSPLPQNVDSGLENRQLYFRLDGRSTVLKDMVREVTGEVTESFRHADYEPSEVLERLGGSFGTRYGFVHEGVSSPAFEQEHFSMRLVIGGETGRELELIYSPAFICEDVACGFLANYLHVLSHFRTNLELPVDRIDVVCPEEKDFLLNHYNDSPSVQVQATLVQLFEDQVDRTPEAVALLMGQNQQMTYSELNRRANALAHYLQREYSVLAEDVVGVMLNRSEDLLVGLLGVLKSGAAYLPLDLDLPYGKLNYILKNANAKMVLIDGLVSDKIGFPDHRVTAENQREIVEKVGVLLKEKYVDSDLSISMVDMLANRMDDGYYDKCAYLQSFVEQVNSNLLEMSKDPHLQLLFEASVLEKAGYISHNSSDLRSFHSFYSLSGNIGVVQFSFFPPLADALDQAGVLMAEASAKDGVIFDLRGCPGGSSELVLYFLSHLLPPQSHIANRVGRDGKVNRIFTMDVEVSCRISSPIAILIDGNTFSAGEEFAFFLQESGRGKVVGSRSQGGGHSGKSYAIVDGVSLFVPEERGEGTSGRGFQSIGVSPDIEIPGEVALERALSEIYGQLGMDANRISDDIVPISHINLNTDHSLRSRFVNITMEGDLIASQFVDNPRPSSDLSNLAYVMYTSGSTGRPKGVEITHSNVANFLLSMLDSPGMDSDALMIAMTSCAFDISVLELFLPLLNGGRIRLLNKQQLNDLEYLKSVLETPGPLVMQSTPALWNLLVESGWEGNPHLKILCGGEKLSATLADKLKDRGGDFWNMYGPTETTVWSSIKNMRFRGKGVTVGKPISNTGLYILDGYRRLLPKGAIGEVAIGGEGVARGYRRNKMLTAEKFLHVPFDGKEGSRIYLTGDLGFWDENGELSIIGRRDFQVKVSGHRVELEGIEKVLLEFDGIKSALVTVVDHGEAEKELIVYYVSKEEIAASDLRNYLMKFFSHSILPTYYHRMEAFPLNQNGKVDRTALPDYRKTAELRGTDDYVPARNMIEKKLIEIWGEILDRKEIGIQHNFFQMGGNSITAIKTVNQINKQLGINVPVKWVFETYTIEGISDKISNRYTWKGGLDEENKNRIYPRKVKVAQIKKDNGLLNLFFAAPLGGILPSTSINGVVEIAPYLEGICSFYGIQAPALFPNVLENIDSNKLFDLDKQDFSSSILEGIVAESVEKILAIQKEGPYLLGGFCTGCILIMEVAKKIINLGKTVKHIILVDNPFWPSYIKSENLQLTYSKHQVAWFLAKDIGFASTIDFDQLEKEINQHPIDEAWEIGNKYLEEHQVLSSKVEPKELKQVYENKFYNDLMLKLFFVHNSYQYSLLPTENTLMLSVKDFERMFSENTIDYLNTSVFTGNFDIKYIDGEHHTLFKNHILPNWVGMISEQLTK